MDIKHSSDEDQAISLEKQEKKFNQLLNVIGLQTPLDYIFLDFAQQKSRLALQAISDTPHFLFHTVSNQEIEKAERPFPHCIFIEKKVYKKFDQEVQTTVEVTEGILWSLSPSDKWNTRDVLPFTDFHLYFMDVLKPLYGYSAEDLYKLLDEKKNELFFVTHGNRTSSESKRIVTLFCTEKNIIVFHIDDVDLTIVGDDEKFMSKWIASDLLLSIHTVQEFALFERPTFQLVSTEEKRPEPTKIQLSTPGLDTYDDDMCVSCSS
jgi:hypothetical protein